MLIGLKVSLLGKVMKTLKKNKTLVFSKKKLNIYTKVYNLKKQENRPERNLGSKSLQTS